MKPETAHLNLRLQCGVGANTSNRLTRRKLLIALGIALAAPRAALAQQPAKVRRIGFFYNGSRQSAVNTGRYSAFLDGMRALGYVEGKHFVMDERFADDVGYTRLSSMATELAKSHVDIIVVTGGPAIRALKQATTTIPVVVTVAGDPVREGIAASLAHPGGNFTGLSAVLDEVYPKHIDFLKLAISNLSRVGLLAKKGNLNHSALIGKVEAAAAKAGLSVLPVFTDSQKNLEPAIGNMARQHADAIIILGDAFFVQHFREIAEIAKRYRLPSIYSSAEYSAAGGLMSYGANFEDNFRRAATYVDKILKGGKPGDLPFEQPTRFYLTINQKTAKALGIKISNELLLRVDKVIE